MDMDSGESGCSDTDSEDIEEIFRQTYEQIQQGLYSIGEENMSLRCPFCPGKKKIVFGYTDLLQHAQGVASFKGKKRTRDAAGKHRALATFLKEDLGHLRVVPQRSLRLEQEAPKRGQDQLVWPWMGVIKNISTKISEGKRVGPGNGEIKDRFAQFNLKGADVLWNFTGHLGMAVLKFDGSTQGYEDAEAFERSFLSKGRGKTMWQGGNYRCDELYGWLARTEDYNANDVLGKHLRRGGSLKTLSEISAQESLRNEHRCEQIRSVLNKELKVCDEKLASLNHLMLETENAKCRAELEKRELEEKYKKELRRLRAEAQAASADRDRARQSEIAFLKNKLEALTAELESLEHRNDQNVVALKEENKRQMQIVLEQAGIQQKHQAQELDLIKKHEEQNKLLEESVHNEKLRLAKQQTMEVEIQELRQQLEIQKLNGNHNGDNARSSQDLEEKLKDLLEEKEADEEMIKTLTYKEREANSELQDAKLVAVEVLKTHGSPTNIGVKRMGEICIKAWKDVCEEKFKYDVKGWEICCAELYSSWQQRVGNSDWWPFKMVKVDGEDDKYERKINEQDEKLATLREDLGEIVYLTVVAAMTELEEYNPSGRYPVSVSWNHEKNREATLAEVVSYLKGILSNKKAKRRRIMR